MKRTYLKPLSALVIADGSLLRATTYGIYRPDDNGKLQIDDKVNDWGKIIYDSPDAELPEGHDPWDSDNW